MPDATCFNQLKATPSATSLQSNAKDLFESLSCPMVVSYSPRRDGGTLHLPSPTNIHHSDPSSAIAQLRRSLSRSPSKGPSFRLVTSKSTSPSPSSPLSPSPRSPSGRSSVAPSPSPLAVPISASSKKSRSVIRRASPMRNAAHLARSPAKRVLSESSDHGNAALPSSMESHSGTENESEFAGRPKPAQLGGVMAANVAESDVSPSLVFARRDNNDYLNDLAAKSSPLKRSDGSRNFDLTHVGSPSAKRRSLHGASFGPDFDIFDQAAVFVESPAPSSNDITASPDVPTSHSPIPKRTSSLRRTTVQQRPTRPKPEFGTFPDFSTPSHTRSRPRISLDTIPQPPRESPFSPQGPLPNASIHPARKTLAPNGLQQRHPLSRTLTQSSSGSSLAEDSPTHIPTKQPEFRRPNAFSKSLPLGSNRPTVQPAFVEESSQSSSFETPEPYKLARPLPSAFMSTGLISKRNKNIDEDQAEHIGHMPDTPCKRPASLATMSPFAKPNAKPGIPRQSRHTMHSFGTPSTPFNPHVPRQGSSLGKGTNIFGSTFNHTRRGSFLSDTEESSQSNNAQTQSSNDFEIPPTPTKQVATSEQNYFGRSLHRSTSSFGFNVNDAKSDISPEDMTKSKSSILNVNEEGGNCEGSEKAAEGSPLTQLRFRSLKAIPSFSNRFDDLGRGRSPSRHSRKGIPLPFIKVSKNNRTNRNSLSPASPLLDRSGPKSPRTPSETMLPPDPSGLSISVRADAIHQQVNFGSSFNSLAPPATPTTNRDSLRLGGMKSSITSIHPTAAAEVDSSLTSRFQKTELIGVGEFSQVFRVTGKRSSNPHDSTSAVSAGQSMLGPIADRVWAVKKTRHHYLGSRDRLRKLQEVDILKTLGQSEHTIQLIESWEFDDRLYIQTEFCEEGSLDLFLGEIGRKARLDDFRIWKIMLELSEPANVFITFEGTLKIGDFGMATAWPAAAGIEGEGDREYIGPEILEGKYDKPADIFALGLIMLEIAGNVMLPDNGVSWQRLRAGDMSDVPSLTSSSLASSISRDPSGVPLSHQPSLENLNQSDTEVKDGDLSDLDFLVADRSKRSKAQNFRAGELQAPPAYMTDPNHEEALDKIVRWMISPNPADRPVADQLLGTAGVSWVQSRRRAGATIYEGNWGPADEVLQDDAEMVDV